MATAKDPVCGMNVQTDKAAAKSEHKGQTYHFCSTGCQQKFEKAPDQYAKQKASTS